MNSRIDRIRQLLSELEVEAESRPAGDGGFSALELPEIVREIVDDLQPLLTPYDAAFYWFLFRHSIANDGSPFVRVSTRSLQKAVVRSSYSQADENTISLGKVQETLRTLEEIGAIRKEGAANRQGTRYRVLIPDEIKACREHRAERVSAEPALMFPEAGAARSAARAKRMRVFERDGHTCRRCGRQLTRSTATLDYVKPPGEGGDESDDNLVTTCVACNRRERTRG
jgi:HNH endonuclease